MSNSTLELTDYKQSAYLADRLIQSGINFTCTPVPDQQRCTFEVDEKHRAYAETQLAEKNRALTVSYKGHNIRCYGEMHETQNVWWATETDEGIHTAGFDSWAEAVVYFIDDIQLPVVELAGC